MEITRMQLGCHWAPRAWGPQGRQSTEPAWEALALGNPSRGIGTGCRALQGVRSFHPDHVCTYVPAVSPHNLENEGPLVAGKEKGHVHSPRLGRAGTQGDKRGQPHTQQGCSVAMAGAPASKTGPVFYRCKSYCKSLSNFCE